MIFLIIILLIAAIVIGLFAGMFGGKFFLWLMNWKIKKGMNQLLDGKYKNKINVGGKEFEVDTFNVEDKVISLKGGFNVKDAPKKEKVSEVRREKFNFQKGGSIAPGENSRSNGEKKRNIGRRLRKFG